MRTRLRSVVALVVLGALAASASADLDGSEFESLDWRVRMTAPRDWQLSERSSYPNVLLWMSRRSPKGKMLFAAERLAAPESALDYARRTATSLEAMGFRVRAPQLHSATGAYWIDAENRSAFLRQAFLVADQTGYTLTLAADDGRARSQHLRAFEAALRSIRIVRDAASPAPAAGSQATP